MSATDNVAAAVPQGAASCNDGTRPILMDCFMFPAAEMKTLGKVPMHWLTDVHANIPVASLSGPVILFLQYWMAVEYHNH